MDPNELVLTFRGSYVCANFGENRSRNATVRVPTDGQTHRHIDANRFYNLSHAICYSYGTDNNNQMNLSTAIRSYLSFQVRRKCHVMDKLHKTHRLSSCNRAISLKAFGRSISVLASFALTRNTFCGTWYLPHSHVHN